MFSDDMLRKAVGAAFSSVSVLNASFRCVGKGIGSTAEFSGVDLLKAGGDEQKHRNNMFKDQTLGDF